MPQGYTASKDDEYLSIISHIYNLSRKIYKDGAFCHRIIIHIVPSPFFRINAVAPRLFLRFEPEDLSVHSTRQFDRLDPVALRQPDRMDISMDLGRWILYSYCQWAVSRPHLKHLHFEIMLNTCMVRTNQQNSRPLTVSWLLQTATHTLLASQTTTERQPLDQVSQNSFSTANSAFLARHLHRAWTCGRRIHRVSIYAMETFPGFFE